MRPQLVSFRLCPFVQRAAIVLREKKVDFDIAYIELDRPPEWFTAISPLGKVPLLRVGDEVLFESAVIMEYLDEVNPPSLHPRDPLRKAQHRAWFEFAGNLFGAQYRLTTATDKAGFDHALEQLRADLKRLDGRVRGPWFEGAEFHLVDAAFAPFFMRRRLLEEWRPHGLFDGLVKLPAWEEALLARPSVRNSVVEEFAPLYRDYIAARGGWAARFFARADLP